MIYYRSSSEILPEPEAPLLRRAVREEEQVIFPGPRAAGHHLHLLNLSDQYVVFHRLVLPSRLLARRLLRRLRSRHFFTSSPELAPNCPWEVEAPAGSELSFRTGITVETTCNLDKA